MYTYILYKVVLLVVMNRTEHKCI